MLWRQSELRANAPKRLVPRQGDAHDDDETMTEAPRRGEPPSHAAFTETTMKKRVALLVTGLGAMIGGCWLLDGSRASESLAAIFACAIGIFIFLAGVF